MEDEPAMGWSEDPNDPNRYRYWNGREWSWHASTYEDGHGGTHIQSGGTLGGWNGTWYRKVLRNTVVFHTMAWFDCSVPGTRGHLRRFMEPKEQRTLDQFLALRKSQ